MLVFWGVTIVVKCKACALIEDQLEMTQSCFNNKETIMGMPWM